MVRMQPHQFPFIGPQLPGPLPDASRHGDPAEVVHQPGPVDGLGRGRRDQIGGRARQPGNPSRVAGEPRALEVGGVPETGQGLLQAASPRNARRGARLGVDHGRPQVIRAGHRQQLARRVRENRHDRRIQRPPGPAGHRLLCRLGAPDGVEHHRRVTDGGEPRRLGDLRAGPACWDTEAVEALEAVQDRAPDPLRQPEAGRQVSADLTVCPCPLGLQPRDARRAAHRAQPHRVHAQASQELHGLGRLGRIDEVSPGADHDVVAAEHRGDLVRGRRTAGEPHQRPVVDLALITLIEPRPASQFRREQARAHRLA